MDQSKSAFSPERVKDLILPESEEDYVARRKMKQTNRRMRVKQVPTIAMLLISIALALLATEGGAQETKGGGLKGGGLASAFKKNIVSLQQKQVIQPQPVLNNFQQSSFSSTLIKQQAVKPLLVNQQVSVQEEQVSQLGAADSEPAIYGSVSGTPGVDFPAFTSIPNTPFTCEGRPFDPGMYADESTGCQVYHLCYQGRRESFLCGVGTVFSQAIMNCDFWHSVDCSKSAEFYHLNAEFGKSSGEPGATQQLQQAFAGRLSAGVGSAAPQVVSKTSSVVSSNQQSALLRPATFSRVESSSEFNSRTNGATAPLVATKGGFAQQQSSGFLSAAQQAAKLGRLSLEPALVGLPDTSAQQSESAMSMSISKESKQPAVANEALYGLKRPAQLRPGSVKGASQPASSDGFERLKLAPAADNGIQPAAANNEEWKPYFKSKSSPRPLVPATSAAPTIPTSATTQPTPQAQPDQEPVFSSNRDEAQEKPTVPKSSSPPADTTSSTSTSASAVEVEASGSPESESKSGEESTTSTTTSAPIASSAESSTESSSAAPTEGAASSESTNKQTETEETSSATPGVEYESSTTSAESERKKRS